MRLFTRDEINVYKLWWSCEDPKEAIEQQTTWIIIIED